MPGRGRIFERPYSTEEVKALGEATTILGESTLDIYLNDSVCWRNIPVKIWDFTISGYAVIKKWLSYREKELLGRGLSVEEARFVTETARRIAALLLAGPTLDANYAVVTREAFTWSNTGSTT